MLEVAPDLQGRGLGTAVLRHVLARAAAERRPVVLRVHLANERARRLYERLGFRVVAGTDTNYARLQQNLGVAPDLLRGGMFWLSSRWRKP